MIIASQVAMVGAICHKLKILRPSLQAHLDDNDGEVLPHLALADFVRDVVIGEAQEITKEFWDWLAEAFADGDSDVQELIVTGALEAIPRFEDGGPVATEFLPPSLAMHYPFEN